MAILIKIRHSISPKSNCLALFEVSPTSYHEVAEVTVPLQSASHRFRLSISGWFRGPLESRLALRPFHGAFADDEAPTLADFISPLYLLPDRQAKSPPVRPLPLHNREYILTQPLAFADQSSIELRDFLHPEIYDQLLHHLNDKHFWSDEPIGPPSVRRFHVPRPNSLDTTTTSTNLVNRLTQLFHSTAFAKLVESFTSLSNPKRRRTTIRQFRSAVILSFTIKLATHLVWMWYCRLPMVNHPPIGKKNGVASSHMSPVKTTKNPMPKLKMTISNFSPLFLSIIA